MPRINDKKKRKKYISAPALSNDMTLVYVKPLIDSGIVPV